MHCPCARSTASCDMSRRKSSNKIVIRISLNRRRLRRRGPRPALGGSAVEQNRQHNISVPSPAHAKASFGPCTQSGHLEAASSATTAQSPSTTSLSGRNTDATSGKAVPTTSETLPTKSVLPGGSNTFGMTSVRKPCGCSSSPTTASALSSNPSSATATISISIAGRCSTRSLGQLRAKCTSAVSGPPRERSGGTGSGPFVNSSHGSLDS